jgi:hypothetical protein
MHVDPVHPDAVVRFNELGARLVSAITEVPAEPQRRSDTFTPDRYHSFRLTEEDLIEDPQVGWLDDRGDMNGIAVAKIGGMRVGLVGDAYIQLQQLARAMAKARPFSEYASVEFLEQQLFAWATACRNDGAAPQCTEFILAALQARLSEHRIAVPISDLFVQSPVSFGRVALRTFPQAIFQRFEAVHYTNESEADRHRQFCERLRTDLQGTAIGETVVLAEPIRARQIALEQIELVVAVLRFFAPAHMDVGLATRLARWGHVPPRTETVLLLGEGDRCVELTMRALEKPGAAVLDDEMLQVLMNAGLREVRDVLEREERTELEAALLNGMATFGRAALTTDLRERLVWYCAGLESVLLKDSNEPIVQNLSERLALLAYDAADQRLAAVEDVRRAYSLRSNFMHHAVDVSDRATVGRLARHGVQLFLRIIKRRGTLTTKKDLAERVDRMKLSGGGPIDGY